MASSLSLKIPSTVPLNSHSVMFTGEFIQILHTLLFSQCNIQNLKNNLQMSKQKKLQEKAFAMAHSRKHFQFLVHLQITSFIIVIISPNATNLTINVLYQDVILLKYISYKTTGSTRKHKHEIQCAAFSIFLVLVLIQSIKSRYFLKLTVSSLSNKSKQHWQIMSNIINSQI